MAPFNDIASQLNPTSKLGKTPKQDLITSVMQQNAPKPQNYLGYNINVGPNNSANFQSKQTGQTKKFKSIEEAKSALDQEHTKQSITPLASNVPSFTPPKIGGSQDTIGTFIQGLQDKSMVSTPAPNPNPNPNPISSIGDMFSNIYKGYTSAKNGAIPTTTETPAPTPTPAIPSDKMSVDDFAQKIKSKYPEYASMDNQELTKKIVDKYPEYSDKVDLTPHDNILDNIAQRGTIGNNFLTRGIADTGEAIAKGVGSVGQGILNLGAKGVTGVSNAITGKNEQAAQFENPVTALEREFSGKTQNELPQTSITGDIIKTGGGLAQAAQNIYFPIANTLFNTANETDTGKRILSNPAAGPVIGAVLGGLAGGIKGGIAGGVLGAMPQTVSGLVDDFGDTMTDEEKKDLKSLITNSVFTYAGQKAGGETQVGKNIGETAVGAVTPKTASNQAGFIGLGSNKVHIEDAIGNGGNEAGVGYTLNGEKINIPEKASNPAGKLIEKATGRNMNSLVKADENGISGLTKMANTAIKPPNTAKGDFAIMNQPKQVEGALKTLWELQRTGKIEGNLDTMYNAGQTLFKGLDKFGKILGQARQSISNDSIDTSDTAKMMEKEMEGTPSSIQASEGFKTLQRYADDLKENLPFGSIFKISKQIGADMTKLYRAGEAGTDSYQILSKVQDQIQNKIDSYIEKTPTGNLPEYQAAMKNYSQLKKISLPFAKSLQVQMRTPDIGYNEAVGLIKDLSPMDILSPVSTGTKLLGKYVSNKLGKELDFQRSREGNLMKFFDAMDYIASKRTPEFLDKIKASQPTLPLIPTSVPEETKQPSPNTIGTYIEKAKKGKK